MGNNVYLNVYLFLLYNFNGGSTVNGPNWNISTTIESNVFEFEDL